MKSFAFLDILRFLMRWKPVDISEEYDVSISKVEE
jgi:hypothetical protein